MIRTTLSFCRLTAQQWVWAKPSDSTSSNLAFSRLAADQNGVFYLSVADFAPTYPFQPGPSSLIKYDVSGNELWRNAFKGHATIEDLMTCKQCVYVTGHFTTAMQVGNSSKYSQGSADIFVAKFDATGNLNWLRSFGAKGNDLGMSMTCDPSGLLYVTGEFSDTVAFDNATLFSKSKHSAFLLKMDPGGQVLAAKSFSCDKISGTAYGKNLKADSHSNIYFLGYFDASLHADTIPLNNNGQSATFFCKLDQAMNVLWGQNTSAYMCMTSALTIDDYDEVTTESECGASLGGGKVFATRYNGAGQVDWSTSLFPPHPTDDIYSQSCASYQMNTLVAGNNWNCPTGGSCYQQLFIAGYDPLGARLFLDSSNCTGQQLSWVQIARVTPTLFAVSGTLNGDLTLGKDLLHAAHPSVFVAMYSVEQTSIINETSESHLLIYPNPASGNVHISIGHSISRLRLYDTFGNCLKQKDVCGPESVVDLSDLPAGMYFIELSGHHRTSLKKLIHF